MADVILFGSTYVAQHDGCSALVEAVIAEAHRRPFRTLGGAKAFVTRKLRLKGLVVATRSDLRRRSLPSALRAGGGEAA